MTRARIPSSLSLLAIGVILTAVPAAAQGNGQNRNNGRRPEVESVDPRTGDTVRDDDYRYGSPRGNGAGKVPPGWCKGVGNPHNTPENCGYRQSSSGNMVYRAEGGRSYDVAHEEFHFYLDRKYGDLAAQRPLDIAYQLQLQLEKRAEHDRWHEQAGIRH